MAATPSLSELHRRLLPDVLAVGGAYPLALTGGYAVQAHGLVDRLSRDLQFATENPEPLERIADAVRAGLEERGWRVRALEAGPLAASLIVTDPVTGDGCEIDVLKEALWRPPVVTEYGLVLSLDDVVGTKVRALADRGLARDLVDVRAAAERWSHAELEELGRRHAPDTFDLSDLRDRLAGAEWMDDSEFAAYGLDDHAIGELRRWAQAWADDIAERLQEATWDEDEDDG
ncbi:nucleotidyl transferase AbiEii/AbiGii toxin family protein [Streptomyces ficellus]|uniref:Nucleotidyl transferase AbiEii/AbiGii toxin family protein n=1 Tax=Streptomyces ficellus TaxID=1977088 RepID=A0ABT7Z4B3_9ACTN|nr:nucleotidyl transferase AbiEii/AbiGii toxin family protein [Streptomyces ficellus]MDN3294343.1 nucleotidyl transferase AbiEii/AbiGii toxin family protein [Streptomyces ficellus]